MKEPPSFYRLKLLLGEARAASLKLEDFRLPVSLVLVSSSNL